MGCELCFKRKIDNVIKCVFMKVVYFGYFLERIVIDILGELFLIKKGNKYILVVVDYYIKWIESFVILNMEFIIIVRVIVEEVIC